MTSSAVGLARMARLAVAPADPATDAQLLGQFARTRHDDPFAELVRRHGPMVLAVCSRVLADRHDAEDAFQAVFLVLARKAGAVRGANLAGWLYAVAVRTARGVRHMRDRQQRLESRVSEVGSRESGAEVALLANEQAAVIDEELAKLSDAHRKAILLCELRGLSRRQAATELGI
ncbi:MAG: sigma-70 family RNA polymerase sigma factor, partial [Gemmataceae bacterium]|nr:sigma-70 family RNA polymerase sigma factor [Gemmataceae bacterium]